MLLLRHAERPHFLAFVFNAAANVPGRLTCSHSARNTCNNLIDRIYGASDGVPMSLSLHSVSVLHFSLNPLLCVPVNGIEIPLLLLLQLNGAAFTCECRTQHNRIVDRWFRELNGIVYVCVVRCALCTVCTRTVYAHHASLPCETEVYLFLGLFYIIVWSRSGKHSRKIYNKIENNWSSDSGVPGRLTGVCIASIRDQIRDNDSKNSHEMSQIHHIMPVKTIARHLDVLRCSSVPLRKSRAIEDQHMAQINTRHICTHVVAKHWCKIYSQNNRMLCVDTEFPYRMHVVLDYYDNGGIVFYTNFRTKHRNRVVFHFHSQITRWQQTTSIHFTHIWQFLRAHTHTHDPGVERQFWVRTHVTYATFLSTPFHPHILSCPMFASLFHPPSLRHIHCFVLVRYIMCFVTQYVIANIRLHFLSFTVSLHTRTKHTAHNLSHGVIQHSLDHCLIL